MKLLNFISNPTLSVLLAFASFVFLGLLTNDSLADGNEILGTPSIPVAASGSGTAVAGTGLISLPGTINIAVPAGATINQVLLYWDGFEKPASPEPPVDTKLTVNGIEVTGVEIGNSPFNKSTLRAFRADITALNMVNPGANLLTVDDDPGSMNCGAGVLVIFDDGSQVVNFQLRDGADYAYINNATGNPLQDVTELQVFTFPAASVDRMVNISSFFTSVSGTVSSGGFRPTAFEITVDGLVNEFHNLLDSNDGDEWDTIEFPPINIPSGVTSLSVQAFSEDRLGIGGVPASFVWLTAGITLAPPPGSIGDTVYCDKNNDGVQDLVDDPGVPGVTVKLECTLLDGSIINDSQVTDADGKYLFTDIPAGAICDVTLDPTTIPADKEPGDNCPGAFNDIDVVANQAYLDADFCLKNRPGSIGDTVYCDKNNDGVQDLIDDPGVPGVTVKLECTLLDGSIINDSQVTDADGKYLFTDIPAGAICDVTLDPTTIPADKEPGDNCPGAFNDINVGANQVFLEADFCLKNRPGSIGDTVYCDKNNDGIQDLIDDPGAPGVTVNLECTLLDGTVINDSQVTDADGKYLFTDIPAGAICDVTLDPATIPADKEPGDNCPGAFNDINVGANQVFLDADFCLKNRPGSIGDTVYCDKNNDGIQDLIDDPGVPGVTVNLECTLLDGTVINDSQVTDADGKYLFTDIPAGAICDVTLDPATIPADKEPGDNCPGAFNDINVGANEAFLDADFCLKNRPGSIGDTVYCDKNNDGIQDPVDDPGVPGVTVNLECTLLDGTVINRSRVTDADGKYLFTDIPAGAICGVTLDPATIPADKEPGDNCPGAFNNIEVLASQGYLDADFCLKNKPGSIGDTVYCDKNNDGNQDPADDPGIPGVTVNIVCTLPDGSITNDSQVTDTDGKYLFSNIPAGSSCDVTVDPSTAPADKEPGDNCPLAFNDIEVVANEAYLDADFCFITTPICPPAIGFETNPAGIPLVKGQIIDDEFASLGILVTTDDPVNHPAMIFDSSMPTGGDDDLGSPNEDFGGPGIGNGGGIGQPGENNLSLGNVLIISEDADQSDPDDNGAGGCISFSFDQPVRVDIVDILDIDENAGGDVIALDDGGNTIVSVPMQTLGNNSYQTVTLNATGVSELMVCFAGSGSIAAITYCVDEEPLLGCIGDRVWEDTNGDGNQDVDEPGISDVTVKLLDAQGNLIDTQITGGNGEYLFADLEAGEYQVMIDETTLPDLFVQTGDPDDVLDGMSTVLLAEGECNLFQDFGYNNEDCVPFEGNVKDKFNVKSYSNNDGSEDWSGNWMEQDPKGGGPWSGNVKISGNVLELNDYPNSGTDPSAKRCVNLEGATSATLKLDFWTNYGVDYNDAFVIEVSSNGGNSYTVLEEVVGNHSSSWKWRSYDITAFATANTCVRMRISNLYGGSDDFVCFDNVEICFSKDCDGVCIPFEGFAKDHFSSRSFNNNDGTVDWASPWMEVEPGSGGEGPYAGHVQVKDGKLRLDDYPNTGGYPSAARAVDLSDADWAILKFKYKTSNYVDYDDKIAVEVSSDGGANYTIVKIIQGKHSDWKWSEIDISDHASDQTKIRFRVKYKYGGDWEFFYVDWVKVKFATHCE